MNAEYDRIQDLVNQHKTIRQMLGHSGWLDEQRYELQTLRDNVSLFTPEILDRINQEVVRAGHQTLKDTDNLIMRRMQNAVIAKGLVTTRILAQPQDLKPGILKLMLIPKNVEVVR